MKKLLNVNVHRAGYPLDAIGELLRHSIIALHVVADQLKIHGRRHAKVQNLADNIRRLKEENCVPGNSSWSCRRSSST